VVSVLQRQIDPEATRNFRTPVLELDSLYGQGPGQQPYLYDATRFRFLLEEIKDDAGTVVGHDLPRNSLGRALIGDPRNDENTIVSQLHLLFLKFHNKIYDALVDEFPLHSEERFEEAQRLVRWHYQWIVLHEFLPRIVGQKAIDDAMSRMDFRFKETTFMPVEFSVAAYRFGHSQVRPAYALHGPGEPPRIATIFPAQPGGDGAPPPPFVGDLRGGRPVAPTHVINWAAFFGPAPAQPSKLIDERLSSSLLNLPFSVVPPAPDEGQAIAERKPIVGSLATRNLQRGRDARLPSGQAIASCLGITTLSRAEVWEGVPRGYGDTPLWYYVLREAAVREKGRRLAGVGAIIVARVFAAMLEADKASFTQQDPGWLPHLGPVEGRFTMSDLVNYTLGTALGQEPTPVQQAAPEPEPRATPAKRAPAPTPEPAR
jgi:hypothetical protein